MNSSIELIRASVVTLGDTDFSVFGTIVGVVLVLGTRDLLLAVFFVKVWAEAAREPAAADGRF